MHLLRHPLFAIVGLVLTLNTLLSLYCVSALCYQWTRCHRARGPACSALVLVSASRAATNQLRIHSLFQWNVFSEPRGLPSPPECPAFRTNEAVQEQGSSTRDAGRTALMNVHDFQRVPSTSAISKVRCELER
ncbi:hypothetical protein GY45DRAFT_179756 [Cubamyces sp. BRFM 1775]|nr:hypothetical protein GY45DRAFT_179756 [Cubamyces sp. BRFM 1775]